jgi:hypothetical protein
LSTEEFDVELSELEIRLERLRSLYEQYFVGIEKIEPTVARKDVDRRFWALRKVKVRNTAKRFKLQTLIQRYNTLQQYWMKVCRQIENGTYVRHLARAKRRMAGVNVSGAPRPEELEQDLGIDDPSAEEVRAAFRDLARSSDRPRPLTSVPPPARAPRRNARVEDVTLAAIPAPTLTPLNDKSGVVPPPLRRRAAPAIPPQPRERLQSETTDVSPQSSARLPIASNSLPVSAPRSPRLTSGSAPRPSLARPAPPPDPNALSDARIDRLYAELERVRSHTGGEPISRAALGKSLRQTEAKLRAKHEGKQVDFRVETKDGKPIIKPVVKR